MFRMDAAALMTSGHLVHIPFNFMSHPEAFAETGQINKYIFPCCPNELFLFSTSGVM